ncbi:MAG: hypothetical protein ACRBDL_00560 [Alphaproteobacteria bacterium]
MFLLFIVLPSAFALDEDDEKPAEQKAQHVIDACWAISLEARSGSTSSARAGILDSALCMEKHIIMLAETKLFANDPKATERTKQNIEKLRFSYGRLYWDLFNGLDACMHPVYGIRCGTENHTMHNSQYARLLEDVLHDVYKQMARYDVPFDD